LLHARPGLVGGREGGRPQHGSLMQRTCATGKLLNGKGRPPVAKVLIFATG
jgi:hypothetical protein